MFIFAVKCSSVWKMLDGSVISVCRVLSFCVFSCFLINCTCSTSNSVDLDLMVVVFIELKAKS